MENSKANKNKLYPQMGENASDTSAEMEWFSSFENRAGIFDNYTTTELKDFQTRMLTDLKNKINKID